MKNATKKNCKYKNSCLDCIDCETDPQDCELYKQYTIQELEIESGNLFSVKQNNLFDLEV